MLSEGKKERPHLLERQKTPLFKEIFCLWEERRPPPLLPPRYDTAQKGIRKVLRKLTIMYSRVVREGGAGGSNEYSLGVFLNNWTGEKGNQL